MKRRAGRKRKAGARHPGGKLKQAHESPAVRAAAMPHRKGLAHPEDQLGESELGRMVLRGELELELATAGGEYARVWRAYVSTVAAPRRAAIRDEVGGIFDCGGCLSLVGSGFCLCAARKEEWLNANRALRRASARPGYSWAALIEVQKVVLHDEPASSVSILRLGLTALAQHFGLTVKAKSRYRYASSENLNEASHGPHLSAQGRR